jgi:hypothetical protein
MGENILTAQDHGVEQLVQAIGLDMPLIDLRR